MCRRAAPCVGARRPPLRRDPLLQQVHGGAHDFTRYTALGHRRLFRCFGLLAAGVWCGPGMALAWSVQCLLAPAAVGPPTKRLLRAQGTALPSAPPWLDPWLAARPGGADAASGVCSLGRRSEETRSDLVLIEGYLAAG